MQFISYWQECSQTKHSMSAQTQCNIQCFFVICYHLMNFEITYSWLVVSMWLSSCSALYWYCISCFTVWAKTSWEDHVSYWFSFIVGFVFYEYKKWKKISFAENWCTWLDKFSKSLCTVISASVTWLKIIMWVLCTNLLISNTYIWACNNLSLRPKSHKVITIRSTT